MNLSLSPEKLDQLLLSVGPKLVEAKQDQLQTLASQIKKGWQETDQLEAEISSKLAPYQGELKEAQEDAAYANYQLSVIRRWVAKNPRLDLKEGRIGLVANRVRTRASDPNLKLPLMFSWLRLLALKQHPKLTPFIENQKQTEEVLDAESKSYQAKAAIAQEWLNRQLGRVNAKIEALDKKTIDLLDHEVVANIELAPDYLKLVPDRAQAIARNYVEANLTSPELLDNFTEFISHIQALIRTPQDQQAAKRRYGIYLSQEVISSEDLAKLNPSARFRFKEYLVFNLQTDWAELGVITQPHIPDVLTAV